MTERTRTEQSIHVRWSLPAEYVDIDAGIEEQRHVDRPLLRHKRKLLIRATKERPTLVRFKPPEGALQIESAAHLDFYVGRHRALPGEELATEIVLKGNL